MPFQILMVFVCVLGADVPDRDQLEEIAARMATRHEDLYDSAASNALFTFANAWPRISYRNVLLPANSLLSVNRPSAVYRLCTLVFYGSPCVGAYWE